MTDELTQRNADDQDGAALNASEDGAVMAVLEAALAAPTVRRSRRA